MPLPHALIERGLGWQPQLPDHRDLPYASLRVPLEQPAVMPATVDLRPQCPPVYDQKSLNACSANAVAGLLEFDRIKQALEDFVPSRLFIYWNGRVLENSQATDRGIYLRDAIKVVAQSGYPPEPVWPYDPAKVLVAPDAAAGQNAARYHALSYYYLATLAEMKTCLAAGFPFAFGFTIYASFAVADRNGGYVPMPGPESSNAGHAVMAVGYNDSTGYFTIRNSWGPGTPENPRGDNGYYYMPYQYLAGSLAKDFWTIRTVADAPVGRTAPAAAGSVLI